MPLPSNDSTEKRLKFQEAWDQDKMWQPALYLNDESAAKLSSITRRWHKYNLVSYWTSEKPSAVITMLTTQNYLGIGNTSKSTCMTINFAYALRHNWDFLAINVPCWRTKLGAGWVKPWALQAAVRTSHVRAPWLLLLDHDAFINTNRWGKPFISKVLASKMNPHGDRCLVMCQAEKGNFHFRFVKKHLENPCTECKPRVAMLKALQRELGSQDFWKEEMGCNVGVLLWRISANRTEALSHMDDWAGRRLRDECPSAMPLDNWKSDQDVFNYCVLARHWKRVALVEGRVFAPYRGPLADPWVIHNNGWNFEKVLSWVCTKHVEPRMRNAICK